MGIEHPQSARLEGVWSDFPMRLHMRERMHRPSCWPAAPCRWRHGQPLRAVAPALRRAGADCACGRHMLPVAHMDARRKKLRTPLGMVPQGATRIILAEAHAGVLQLAPRSTYRRWRGTKLLSPTPGYIPFSAQRDGRRRAATAGRTSEKGRSSMQEGGGQWQRREARRALQHKARSRIWGLAEQPAQRHFELVTSAPSSPSDAVRYPIPLSVHRLNRQRPKRSGFCSPKARAAVTT